MNSQLKSFGVKYLNMGLQTEMPADFSRHAEESELFFSLESVHSSVLEVLESVSGTETASELDQLGARINQSFERLTVSEFLHSLGSDLVKKSYSSIQDKPLKQVYQKAKDQTSDYQTEVLELFSLADPYEFVLREAVELIGRIKDLDRLANLVYLLFQIDNIFLFPNKTATDIVEHLEEQRLEQSQQPLSQKKKDAIIASVGEFVLASRQYKNAWAYIGAENAQQFLRFLTENPQGLRLYRDLLQLMDKGKVFYPPQFYAVLVELKKLYGLGEEKASFDLLERFYQEDETNRLADLVEELNISVTGLNRATEYPKKVLKRLIPSKYRSGSILDLGGSVGLIPVVRAQSLDMDSQIAVIDKLSRRAVLERALVLENELVQKQTTVELNPADIEELITTYPGKVEHIQHKLPLELDELERLLAQAECDPESFQIIFDQRATLLYLCNQEKLAMIKTSLKMLEKNGGGAYFLTKGLADQLLVDIVLNINQQSRTKPLAQVKMVEHTSAYYSGMPLVRGRPLLADLENPTVAERKIRLLPEGKELLQGSFQAERLSHELLVQQIIQSLTIVARKFNDYCREEGPILKDFESNITFDRQIVFAMGIMEGLPIWTPSELVDLEAYQQVVINLAAVIEQIELADKQGKTKLKLSPLGAQDDFPLLTRAINQMIISLSLESKFSSIVQSLQEARRLLNEASLVLPIPYEQFDYHQSEQLKFEVDKARRRGAVKRFFRDLGSQLEAEFPEVFVGVATFGIRYATFFCVLAYEAINGVDYWQDVYPDQEVDEGFATGKTLLVEIIGKKLKQPYYDYSAQLEELPRDFNFFTLGILKPYENKFNFWKNVNRFLESSLAVRSVMF